jgi:hypothetical protein
VRTHVNCLHIICVCVYNFSVCVRVRGRPAGATLVLRHCAVSPCVLQCVRLITCCLLPVRARLPAAAVYVNLPAVARCHLCAYCDLTICTRAPAICRCSYVCSFGDNNHYICIDRFILRLTATLCAHSHTRMKCSVNVIPLLRLTVCASGRADTRVVLVCSAQLAFNPFRLTGEIHLFAG